ncbi:MAG TPA: response regulator [Bryobacteraceae bacterium]|jgi:two-component system, chemotaxis family, response regulator Rcp1|nr:response regulator [Bryobacteraceae bacterium]
MNDPTVHTSAEVLVVEDNPGDIRLLQEAFKEAGINCKLHITRDGEQAMAFLNHEGKYADSPRPSLILLDLNLPRKDGREVLAEIKREEGLMRIPVVVLSTSTSAADIQHAYGLHANCYVPKPADLAALICIGKVIENFWLKAVALPAV